MKYDYGYPKGVFGYGLIQMGSENGEVSKVLPLAADSDLLNDLDKGVGFETLGVIFPDGTTKLMGIDEVLLLEYKDKLLVDTAKFKKGDVVYSISETPKDGIVKIYGEDGVTDTVHVDNIENLEGLLKK